MAEITFDHNHVYVDEKIFYPIISSQEELDGNSFLVTLDASPSSLLKWEEELQKAEEMKEKGKYLVWHLDFDLSASIFSEDPLFRAARRKAVQFFIEKILPKYEESTFSICLYQGSLDQLLASNNSLFEEREQVLDQLLYYLQELALSIPETIPIMAAFDVSRLLPSDVLLLFSRERFSHLLLALKGASLTLPVISWKEGRGKLGSWDRGKEEHPSEDVGFVIPPKEIFSERLLSTLFEKFPSNSIRFLYEDFATDEWEELDALIFVSPLSEKQKRIALGFQAAGGEVVVISPQ